MEKKIRKIRRDIDSNILALYDKKRQKCFYFGYFFF